MAHSTMAAVHSRGVRGRNNGLPVGASTATHTGLAWRTARVGKTGVGALGACARNLPGKEVRVLARAQWWEGEDLGQGVHLSAAAPWSVSSSGIHVSDCRCASSSSSRRAASRGLLPTGRAWCCGEQAARLNVPSVCGPLRAQRMAPHRHTPRRTRTALPRSTPHAHRESHASHVSRSTTAIVGFPRARPGDACEVD